METKDQHIELPLASPQEREVLTALKELVACCTNDDGAISPEPRSRYEWLRRMVDARAAIANAEEQSAESLQDWIVREARAIAGPRSHLQDSEALIQFGLKVARAAIAKAESAPSVGQQESEIEFKYRRELWLGHGHSIPALYGDDGEMQCSQCRPVWDYRRAPLGDVERAASEARLARVAEALLASSVAAAQAWRAVMHEATNLMHIRGVVDAAIRDWDIQNNSTIPNGYASSIAAAIWLMLQMALSKADEPPLPRSPRAGEDQP